MLEPGYELISEEERIKRLRARLKQKNRRSAMSGAGRSEGSSGAESRFAELAVRGPGGKKPTKLRGGGASSLLKTDDRNESQRGRTFFTVTSTSKEKSKDGYDTTTSNLGRGALGTHPSKRE